MLQCLFAVKGKSLSKDGGSTSSSPHGLHGNPPDGILQAALPRALQAGGGTAGRKRLKPSQWWFRYLVGGLEHFLFFHIYIYIGNNHPN